MPRKYKPLTPDPAKRLSKLLLRVDPHCGHFWNDSECWAWTGPRDPKGYARCGTHSGFVHRAIYDLTHGGIPEGHEIDHRCENKWCVNPDHLEAVTHRENILRATRHPRHAGMARTHCKNGHPFTEENTYRTGPNTRVCRVCHREYQRAHQQARRDAKRKAA